MKSFPEKIKEARSALSMSQETLAERLAQAGAPSSPMKKETSIHGTGCCISWQRRCTFPSVI